MTDDVLASRGVMTERSEKRRKRKRMKRSRTRFQEERKEKSQSRIDEPALSRRERTACTLAIFLRSRPRRFDLFASRIPRKPGRTGVSNGEIPSNDLGRRSKREKEEKVDARGEQSEDAKFLFIATETV